MLRIALLAVLVAAVFSMPASTHPPTTEAAVTVVAGAGDISSTGSGDNQTAALVPANAQVITLGDNQYPDGCLDAFNANYQNSWGAFKSRTRPAIGNHDSHDTSCSVDGNGYFDYFNGVGSGTCSYTCPAGRRGEGWYSYNAGDWHFIVLNSECNGTSYDFCDHTAQLNWLASDLAANSGKACTLAYWHRPIVAPSSTHTDDEGHFANAYLGGDNVWQKLYDGGVDVVLAGHDHLYARYARYNRAGNNTDPNGIRHFIVGTGGNGNYSITETKPGQEYATATLGIIKLTLNPTNYSWQFVNTSNTVLDSGSDSCRGTSSDSDGDGWSDASEATIGTNPNQRCGVNAWPADITNDGRVDIYDIVQITNSYARGVPPAAARVDLAPTAPDRLVDIYDISREAGLFGNQC